MNKVSITRFAGCVLPFLSLPSKLSMGRDEQRVKKGRNRMRRCLDASVNIGAMY